MTSEGMHFNLRDAIGLAYDSFNRARGSVAMGPDRMVRHPEWTRRLLGEFGNPDCSAYNIAVTGSKGKGSHAILLAAMLERFGLRTGLFTGPHLVDFLERFRIDGEMISESRFKAYIQAVHQVSLDFAVPHGQYIGPVGMLAVVASLWFQDEKTDVNVYELGRGALHDDVNQVRHHGAIVSPVFLEHVQELGPTLFDVAVEKAGIVAGTGWVSSSLQSSEVLGVLAQHCSQVGSTLNVLGQDFDYRVEIDSEADIRVLLPYEEGTYQIRLSATHQAGAVDRMMAGNAAVAFDAARRVFADLYPGQFPPREVDLRRLRLPGRLQVLSENPLIVLDGTIHAQSAVYMQDWAMRLKKAKKINQLGLLVAIPAEKDGPGVLQILAKVADWVIVARTHNAQLYFDDGLVEVARSYFSAVYEVDFIEAGLARAQELMNAGDGLCIVGTQSFVGDALRVFQYATKSIWTKE